MSNINDQAQLIADNSDAHEYSERQSSLFTTLSPEIAATVSGGGGFGFNARFDFRFPTKVFTVRRGGTIALASGTSSTRKNREFIATIFNEDTKRSSSKLVSVGPGRMTQWTGVRGGNYRILLEDARDGQYVSGSFGVGYTS